MHENAGWQRDPFSVVIFLSGCDTRAPHFFAVRRFDRRQGLQLSGKQQTQQRTLDNIVIV